MYIKKSDLLINQNLLIILLIIIWGCTCIFAQASV